MSEIKDLTRQAPRSPRERLGDYVILARMIDKGRAIGQGKGGAYNFACPLDQILLQFKELSGDDLKRQIDSGAGDEAILQWVNGNGASKTAEEIRNWSDQTERLSLIAVPDKSEWFTEECQRLGLDPQTASLFDLLDADDRDSFAG